MFRHRFTILVCILLLVYITVLPQDEGRSPSHLITRESIIHKTPAIDKVPKIFHQTWKDDHIPEEWTDGYDECHSKYPEWKRMLWTDQKAREFIAAEYPSFLKRYDGYAYPIQRVDALRYFILYHFGGIYMDLDIGCDDLSIENLLYYDAVIPKTKPIGYSNDMLISRKGHPFFKQLIDHLPNWDRWLIFPYLTVFFSTGPMFLNIQYSRWDGVEALKNPVWVLDTGLYSDGSDKIFKHFQGSTWHSWDAWLIKSIWSKKWILLGVVILLVVGGLRRKRSRSNGWLHIPSEINSKSNLIRSRIASFMPF